MADDDRTPRRGLLDGLRRRASDAVARQEAAFARGKVAGKPVYDDAGTLIVDAGHLIDDSVVERAAASGRLHAVAAAAVTAATQDLREKASEQFARTAEGREARALGSVEEFAEARGYIGRYAGVDVTDVRGAVIIPAGKRIDEHDVQAAREAGLLSALIYSAQQPQPPGAQAAPGAAPAPGPQTPPDSPLAAPAEEGPQPRRTVPLVKPPES